MEQRGNHPSIILWVVFNEAWGQFDTVEVTVNRLQIKQSMQNFTTEVTSDVMARDPLRLVTGASGWDDFPVGHIADAHVYPGPSNNGAKVIIINSFPLNICGTVCSK